MHGVGQQAFGDRRRPHDLRLQTRLNAFVGEPPSRIFRQQQLTQGARRVAQRSRDRVPAIHDDGPVGLTAQGVTAGTFEALAPLGLLAGGARFGA